MRAVDTCGLQLGIVLLSRIDVISLVGLTLPDQGLGTIMIYVLRISTSKTSCALRFTTYPVIMPSPSVSTADSLCEEYHQGHGVYGVRGIWDTLRFLRFPMGKNCTSPAAHSPGGCMVKESGVEQCVIVGPRLGKRRAPVLVPSIFWA
jgi:hypothetical protein